MQKGTPATEEEKAARREEGRTQGKEGCRMKRINMTFTDPNYKFIKVVSAIRGESVTRFVNSLIEEYRDDHPDVYEAALKVIAMTEPKADKEKSSSDDEEQA